MQSNSRLTGPSVYYEYTQGFEQSPMLISYRMSDEASNVVRRYVNTSK